MSPDSQVCALRQALGSRSLDDHRLRAKLGRHEVVEQLGPGSLDARLSDLFTQHRVTISRVFLENGRHLERAVIDGASTSRATSPLAES